jgi:Zn-ribbon RNA-binding protein
MKLICSSCGISLIGQENFVKFNCPNCSEIAIVRCKQCKTLSIPYKCEKCNFEGP